MEMGEKDERAAVAKAEGWGEGRGGEEAWSISAAVSEPLQGANDLLALHSSPVGPDSSSSPWQQQQQQGQMQGQHQQEGQMQGLQGLALPHVSGSEALERSLSIHTSTVIQQHSTPHCLTAEEVGTGSNGHPHAAMKSGGHSSNTRPVSHSSGASDGREGSGGSRGAARASRLLQWGGESAAAALGAGRTDSVTGTGGNNSGGGGGGNGGSSQRSSIYRGVTRSVLPLEAASDV